MTAVDPQRIADKFLCAFNVMAEAGHHELALSMAHMCRATRSSHRLWDYIQFQSTKRATPLKYAALCGNAERVAFLLDHCGDNDEFYAPRCRSNNPLHLACIQGYTAVAVLLIQKGAPVDVKDSNGVTPLMIACGNDHVETAAMLLDRGADINAVSSMRETALMMASKTGDITLMTLLLEHGADANAVCFRQRTALTCARDARTVPLLCQYGARLDTTTSGVRGSGVTALMEFSKDGRIHMVRALLENGADVNARGWLGRTALMMARHAGYTDIVALLEDYGADINGASINRMGGPHQN